MVKMEIQITEEEKEGIKMERKIRERRTASEKKILKAKNEENIL